MHATNWNKCFFTEKADEHHQAIPLWKDQSRDPLEQEFLDLLSMTDITFRCSMENSFLIFRAFRPVSPSEVFPTICPISTSAIPLYERIYINLHIYM